MRAIKRDISKGSLRVKGVPVDVRIENVVKAFGETAALHDVSLEIAGGELIALLGPSGSGKTTLLRVIAGLEFPNSGRVAIGAEDASRKTVQERNVGFVFQHYALFKHMTVFDNVAFGLRVGSHRHQHSAAGIRERVLTLLDLVQLSGLERRYPAQLSGGQRQRVALARALAIEPRILLLDEPFGALDYKVRKELRRWLRDLHERIGHTTIFVTHDQEEALELADRVVVMSNGKIEQVGTADDIYDRPASPFVAGFIGEAVQVPVEIEDGALVVGEQRIRPANLQGSPSGSAILFVRPNDLVLAQSGAPEAISGVVRNMRRAGAQRRVELVVSERLPALELDLPQEKVVGRGDSLTVALTHVRLFERGTA